MKLTSYHARTLLDMYGISPGQNVSLEDSVLDLSECSCLFKERECRCPANIHALDKRTFHRDRVDPREDPIGHLLFDCTEEVLAAGTTFVFFYFVCEMDLQESLIASGLVTGAVYLFKRLRNEPIPIRVKGI